MTKKTKMVNSTIIKNKDGEVLTTKDGVELMNHILEVGDIFIPLSNSIMTTKRVAEVEEKGKKIKKTIENYKLKIKVLEHKDEFIFVSLTPSQAKSLTKKINDGVLLNQHLFCAYTYKDSDDNEWVGVGFKNKSIKAKNFEDFKEILDNSEEVVVVEKTDEVEDSNIDEDIL